MPDMSIKSKYNATQSVLSSYFSQSVSGNTLPSSAKARQSVGQRSSSPVDLTAASDEERPMKRRKVVDASLLVTPSHVQDVQQAVLPPTVDQYRFSTQPSTGVSDQERKKTRANRHERAKQILLSGLNVLDRAVDGEYLPEEQSDAEEPSQLASGAVAAEDSGDKFTETLAFFAHASAKSQTNRKKAAPNRLPMKQQEIGPSGEPYTPLELQVSE
jgi:DNA mismatch repair protein MSH3